MKRRFYLLFTALLMMATTSAWADDVQVDGLYYSLDETNKNATLTTKNQSRSDDVYIPAKITYNDVEYTVNKIENNGFRYGTFSKLEFESPSNITSIGDWTFAECPNITEVVVPEGVTTFTYARAFGKMNGLKKITLPTSLKNVYDYTFSADPALVVVVFLGSTPPNFYGSNIFGDGTVIGNITFVVPDGSVDAYKAKSQLSNANVINSSDYKEYTAADQIDIDGIYYNLNLNGTATVTYPNESEPKQSNPSSYTGEISIPAKVTYNNQEYTVTSIGAHAFQYSSITSITFSEGLLTIENYAFNNCKSITEVELPNSVTTIGSGIGDPFGSCSKLNTFTIGTGVTSICQGLTYGSPVKTVYIKTSSVPTGSNYMFTNSPTIHVYADMVSKFQSASYWSSYTYAGDLEKDYTYDEVKAKVEEMKSVNVADYTGTNPGWYTEESVASYNKAITDFANLSENAVASEINAEMKVLIAAQNALVHNPIVEGYYYIVCDNHNIADNNKSEKALYTNESAGQLYWGELETNDLKHVFKLTKNSDDTWNLQNMATGLYAGAATGFCGTTSVTNKATYPATFYYDGEGSFRIIANDWTYCPQGNPSGTASGPSYVWGFNAIGMHGEASYQLRTIDETVVNKLMASLLEELVNDKEEASSDPGRYTESSAEVYNTALQNAKSVINNGTDEEKINAYIAFLSAYRSLEVNSSITDGYYFITSAGNGNGLSGGPYNYEDKDAMYNDGGTLKWKAYNKADVTELYRISANANGGFDVYSVANSTYINKPSGNRTYGTSVTTSAEPTTAQVFTLISNGKFAMTWSGNANVYALSNGHNGSSDASGTVGIWGTVSEATKYGINVWYLHKVSKEDAEQLISDGITSVNPNKIVEAPGLSGTNILSDGVVENLVLTDGYSFAPSAEFTATNATYSREMKNTWGTICLPFAITPTNDVEIYQVKEIGADGSLIVTSQTELAAGTPALIKKISEKDSVTFNVESAEISTTINNQTVGNIKVIGSYTYGQQITDGNNYYIKDNSFRQRNNSFYADAFRAYLEVTDNSSSQSPIFNILVDDDPTGITTAATSADASDEIEGVYSISGVKQSDLQKGINIIRYRSGKTQKVILK